jgi:hypothetical protein
MQINMKNEPNDSAELLQKLLVVQLHALGTPQDRIAKIVGRQKLWVNGLLKGVPRQSSNNANDKETKHR